MEEMGMEMAMTKEERCRMSMVLRMMVETTSMII